MTVRSSGAVTVAAIEATRQAIGGCKGALFLAKPGTRENRVENHERGQSADRVFYGKYQAFLQ